MVRAKARGTRPPGGTKLSDGCDDRSVSSAPAERRPIKEAFPITLLENIEMYLLFREQRPVYCSVVAPPASCLHCTFKMRSTGIKSSTSKQQVNNVSYNYTISSNNNGNQ